MPKGFMEPVAAGPEDEVRGLPLWYFVLAGLLVGSGDLTREFQHQYPWVLYIPTVLIFVHLGLWFTVLRRRRRYWRAVVRSPKARLLAIGLALLRLGLGLLLARLYTGAHQHLILAVTMIVVVPASAYLDQVLILRTLRGTGQGASRGSETVRTAD